MVVVRLGQGFWRWVAIGIACGLIAAVVRWGSGAVGLDVRMAGAGASPLSFVPTHDPALALTFDADTPGTSLDGVLRTLTAFGVPGTFFVGANLLTKSPAIVRALAAAGEQVELAAPAGLGGGSAASATLRAEVQRLSALAAPPHFVRPAPGAFGQATVSAAESQGLTVVGWSVDPQDWAPEGADVVIGRVLGAASAGDIVLLRCTPDTVQALPAIVEGLRSRGLELTTLDGLLALADGTVAGGGTAGAGAG